MKPDPEIELEISPSAYAPSDDSYLMLEALHPGPGQRVLEIGTGSGIIALHCAKAGARAAASDISRESLDCARRNAKLNGLDIEFIRSDLFSSVSGKFDIIIFNPPYLSSRDSDVLAVEDKRQIVGGQEGHEISVRFLRQAGQYLKESGKIYLLTSTETADMVIQEARQRFLVEKVKEQRMFFEVLAVWELRLDKN